MTFTNVELDLLDGLHGSLKNAIGYASCLRAELLERAVHMNGNEDIEHFIDGKLESLLGDTQEAVEWLEEI